MATPEKKEQPEKLAPLIELPKCSKTSAAPPNPDNYGPIVTVAVGNGDSKRKFYAHEGLLSHHSSYFKAASKNHWGTSKIVELKDDSPEVFNAFFHWIYRGQLYFMLNTSAAIPLSVRLICEIYVFGDARGVPGLCNAAIDLLLQNFHREWKVPLAEVRYVYDNTLHGSALRKIFVDICVETFRFEKLSDPDQRELELETYCKAFFADVVVEFMALGSTPIPSNSTNKMKWANSMKDKLCPKYHDHSPPPT